MLRHGLFLFWCGGLLLILPSLALAGQLGQGTGSSYPTALDTKTTFTDKVSCITSVTTRICAATPNDLQAAIVNIETELGLLPKGSYATVVARLNAAAYLTTANTFTAVQTLSLVTPSFVMTDTTALAKSLTIAVGANVANFRESAGASGSLLALDLANLRVGIGTASPVAALQVESASTAAVWFKGTLNLGPALSTSVAAGDISVARSTTSGYVNLGSDGAVYLTRPSGNNLALIGSNVGIGTTSPNVGLEMGATLDVRIPHIKSTTGTLYVCVDTNGTLSKATSCSGT